MLVQRNGALPVLAAGHGLERLFDDLFRGASFEPPAAGGRWPAVDAWEDEANYHVEAELPGVNEKDLEISVIEDELRIAGGGETEKKGEATNYHRRERVTGRFSRVLRFPISIDGDKVQAKYTNGVLHVTLPKAAAALPRRIEVKS